MAEYRAYAIGADGHIVRPVSLICDDDRQAMEQAGKAFDDHAVEVWSGERLVGPGQFRALKSGYLSGFQRMARSAFAEFFLRRRR